MRVSDLQAVNEIDSNIQSLLGELASLYQTREQLFKESTKSTSKKRKSTKSLDNIDLSSFDLSIDE